MPATLQGKVKLPSQEGMEASVAEGKQWRRSFMPVDNQLGGRVSHPNTGELLFAGSHHSSMCWQLDVIAVAASAASQYAFLSLHATASINPGISTQIIVM